MEKVLHVLEHSLPKLAGYTIRSKYIVEHQIQGGWRPLVITSPLQGKTERELKDYETINNIRYYRTGLGNRLDQCKPLPIRLMQRYAYSRSYLRDIQRVVQTEQPQIVHAHSSYLNGVRANAAAKKLGIPSVYEVRGLWQDTAAASTSIDTGHWKYRFIDYMDRKAMLGASRVITISELLREELIAKGIPAEKIHVVPNGVDTNVFQPRAKDKALVEKYNLAGKTVFGFIGSIRSIEGLSRLIEVFPKITNKYQFVKVVLVGDGDEVVHLRSLSEELGLNDRVIFTGRVDHAEILDYYSIMDVLVYPRIDAKVNQKVTPLKPLEAMAMEKVVIGSDVGGLAELIKEGINGLLFRVDDSGDLERKCNELLADSDKMASLGKQARQWVVENREWRKIIKLYDRVYRELL